VVVALLRAQELVAGQQHRHALREEEGGNQVARLSLAQGEHLGIVGRALGAAIPAAVLIEAVAIVFAVGFVVLLVVGNEIEQGEAVVAGDEVDGMAWMATPGLVEVRAAADASGEGGGEAGLAAPEAADVIAIAAVPLRPALPEREAADLVEPCRIPGLGDELG